MNKQELNKEIVKRFNKEFIEQGRIEIFDSLVSPSFINHTAPGEDKSSKPAFEFIENGLRKAFPDLVVEILDQIAEDDKVVTRKSFIGTHTHEFLGVAPSYRKVCLNVIDIIILKDGKYSEHWSIRDFQDLYR